MMRWLDTHARGRSAPRVGPRRRPARSRGAGWGTEGDQPLAYAFWHAPVGTDRTRYETAIAGFHRALAECPPPGFVGSWSVRLPTPTWFAAGAVECYLDCYIVEHFEALGVLNTAAVSGHRQVPHDEVAPLAGGGAGGVLRLVSGSPGLPDEAVITFIDKARGVPYAEHISELGRAARPAAIWMRQMVLGPGPELWVLNEGPGPALPGAVLQARLTTVIRSRPPG